jgi:hypothetical protein
MTLPDHFEGEDCIITFEKEYADGADGESSDRTLAVSNVEGKILSWNMSGGAQPTEDVPAFGGKIFNFQKTREKFSVSFEVMIDSSDFSFVQFGGASGSVIRSMAGKVVKSTDTTRRWRVCLYLQSAEYHIANATKTVVVPSKTQSLLRVIFVDVKSVTFDKEFSADEYMKGTLTLEFSAASSEGYANYIEQEGIYTTTAGTAGQQLAPTWSTAAVGSADSILIESRGYVDWGTSATAPAWYVGATTTDTSLRYRYTGS